MTLRISQFAVMCGLSMVALPGVVQAQAPRYQSPLIPSGNAATPIEPAYAGSRLRRTAPWWRMWSFT
jgi:hypothetical protein